MHGFVPFPAPASLGAEGKHAVALLFFGEGEGAPAELGHDGAGKFLDDLWALVHTSSSSGEATYSWLRLAPQLAAGEKNGPEARGWFAFDSSPSPASGSAGVRVALQGGLNEGNERLSDAWVLDVVAAPSA